MKNEISKIYEESNYLMTKVCKLYYYDNYQQREIADMLGISPPTISRLINKAKSNGIITFSIPDKLLECLDLEEKIIEKYNINEAIITPIEKNQIGDMESIRKEIAKECARYLQRTLKSDTIIGFSWGMTINCALNYLNPTQRKKATLLSLTENILLPKRTELETYKKAYQFFSESILSINPIGFYDEQGNRVYFNYAGKTEDTRLLLQKAEAAITGVGTVQPFVEHDIFDMANAFKFSTEDLVTHDVVGVFLNRFFMRNGKEYREDNGDKIGSISFANFKKIPKKILVSRGEHKALAVKTLIEMNMANVLIIDESLARLLVNL